MRLALEQALAAPHGRDPRRRRVQVHQTLEPLLAPVRLQDNSQRVNRCFRPNLICALEYLLIQQEKL